MCLYFCGSERKQGKVRHWILILSEAHFITCLVQWVKDAWGGYCLLLRCRLPTGGRLHHRRQKWQSNRRCANKDVDRTLDISHIQGRLQFSAVPLLYVRKAWTWNDLVTCNRKSKRASLPHSECWIPTQGAVFTSASVPQWTCSSFWYWSQLSGTEFWSLSWSAMCWISGSHHTTGLGAPLMYRYGRISLLNVRSTAGRLLLSPSTLSRWKANTSNQSSVRLISEQRPRWQRSLCVSGCWRSGPCWDK